MPGSPRQMAWNVPEAKMDLPSQPVQLRLANDPGLTSKPRLSSDVRSVQSTPPPALPPTHTRTLAFVLSCDGNLKWGFGNFLETSHCETLNKSFTFGKGFIVCLLPNFEAHSVIRPGCKGDPRFIGAETTEACDEAWKPGLLPPPPRPSTAEPHRAVLAAGRASM